MRMPFAFYDEKRVFFIRMEGLKRVIGHSDLLNRLNGEGGGNSVLLRLHSVEIPRHDFQDSMRYEEAVMEAFDCMASIMASGEGDSLNSLSPQTLLALFSRRLLPLLLVDLRCPSALLEVMKEQKIPLEEQRAVVVRERSRNVLLRQAAQGILYSFAWSLDRSRKQGDAHPANSSSSSSVAESESNACLWLLYCLENPECGFTCTAEQSLLRSSHEELWDLRAHARESPDERGHTRTKAWNVCDTLAKTLVPSPLIAPLSTRLAKELVATCLGDGSDEDEVLGAAGAEDLQYSAEREQRNVALRTIASLVIPRAIQGPDDEVTVCVALGRLWASMAPVSHNPTTLPWDECVSVLIGHAVLSALGSRKKPTVISATSFVALSPLALQLLHRPLLRSKMLGSLLLRQLLSADSTTLTGAATSLVPAISISLSSCDDSAQWSGVTLALSRCLGILLTATASAAVSIAQTHKLVCFHCERVAMKQTFTSAWNVATALPSILSRLSPAYLSLHAAALCDLALVLLNTWHLSVQTFGLWLLALLLHQNGADGTFPVLKVAVELVRVFLFYTERPGGGSGAVVGVDLDVTTMPDLSNSSPAERRLLVDQLLLLCSAIRARLPGQWGAALDLVEQGLSHEAWDVGAGSGSAHSGAGAGSGYGAEARELTLVKLRDMLQRLNAMPV